MNVRIDEQDQLVSIKDLKIEIKINTIEINYKEKSLLSGVLHSTIKPDESTWYLRKENDNEVELVLAKTNANEMWSSFLKDRDIQGEYSRTDQIDQETNAFLNKLKSEADKATESSTALFALEQQLEECDGILDDQMMSNCDNNDDKLLMFRRLDGRTHEATHKSYINDNKFLFDVIVSPNKSPCLCLRHDVDGIIWQPSNQPNSVWLTHEYTFLAFGYVQASKLDTKYRSCSQDYSYSAIFDTQKHIYIYKQSSEKVETQLKNRKTGKLISQVAKQYLISLDSDQEIYGYYCANDFLIVLLKEQCFIYKMNPNSK